MQNTFYPGQQWLYFKIYCGYHTADKIIAKTLLPFSCALIQQNSIEKWFFIRYHDPDHHIRYRLKINQAKNNFPIIEAIQDHLRQYELSGAIYTLEISTYKREIQRYPEQSYDKVESWFYHESALVANLIDQVIEMEDSNGNYRWHLALIIIHNMLDIYEMDFKERSVILSDIASSFGKEFNTNSRLRHQLADKVRNNMTTAAHLLTDELPPEVQKPINQWIVDTKDLVREILPDKTDKHLVSSYLHMFCNRFFRSRQRLHEYVLYDLLARYYNQQYYLNTKTAVNK